MNWLLRKPFHPVLRRLFGKHCYVCGKKSLTEKGHRLWEELIQEWELSPEWADRFSRRESEGCSCCGIRARSQSLAKALVKYAGAARSLKELTARPSFQRLAVAEINSAGGLHPYLEALPNLAFSEYGGDPHEDLMALSYADSIFDLVITSETLEHLPDADQGLAEVWRVLKPGGAHVFTVPVVWDRQTRVRASMANGEIVHHLLPSYHGIDSRDYLVFYEFGHDFVQRCERAGFTVEVVDNPNPALRSFITRKR
jgi:SAM-dependent methyltransferase